MIIIKAIRPDVVLIAKIENSEGLQNCSDIAASADAIMIDRGDLVAEIGYENLFSGIETIAQATKSHGKPLIMATENLESMLGRELPSKSEVVSLAHSASIGVDCFMLSEETAISNNAFVIVNWLHNFSKKLAPKKEQLNSDTNLIGYKSDIWRSIACYPDLNVFVMSKSGRALTRYLSVHPDLDFFLLTDSSKVKNWCRLYSNSINTHIGDLDKKQNLDLIMKTINKHKKTIFSRDDKVLAVYVSEYSNTPRANTITIFHKEDFY